MFLLRILLQFPDGLKKEALKYAEKFRKEGHEVVLSGSPCYGACDLALKEAEIIKADKIIHFGHAPFLKNSVVPVEYIEWPEDVNIEKIKESAKKIKEKKIALATTVQHINRIKEIKTAFEEIGKEIFLSKGNYAFYEGQVLGCDFGAVKHPFAQAAVIIADGKFHALGVFVDYPVYSIHPRTGELKNLSEAIEKARKIRKGAILRAVNASSFGVLVSTKPGQFRLKIAEDIAARIRSYGKKAEVVVCDDLNPSTLSNFFFDAFINTACPRIADDTEIFDKPVINFDSVIELFKLWDDLGSR